jgi:hypothetical protein
MCLLFLAFLPGATREGETLTLEVDDGALPPGAGAVHVRWQRGARGGGLHSSTAQPEPLLTQNTPAAPPNTA